MITAPGNRVIWQSGDDVFFRIKDAPAKLRPLLHDALEEDPGVWGSGIFNKFERTSAIIGAHTKRTGFIHSGPDVLPRLSLKMSQLEDADGRPSAVLTKQLDTRFVASLIVENPRALVRVKVIRNFSTLVRGMISHAYVYKEPSWGLDGFVVLDPSTNKMLTVDAGIIEVL